MSDVTQISGNQIKDGAIVNAKVSPSASIDYTKINFASATPSIIGAESVLTFTSPLSRTSNTISLNVVPVNKGGTGIASAVEKQIYFANNSGTFAQSPNLNWDFVNSRLGIKTATPLYEIDVAGSIRCDGQFLGILNGTSYFTRGFSNTNDDTVTVENFTVPSAGQVLIALSDTEADWGDITADGILPDQSGNGSKFLSTNGTTASWEDLPTDLPDQTGNNGKYLATNGTNATWESIPSDTIHTVVDNTGTLALDSSNSGNVLTNTGAVGATTFTLPAATSSAGVEYIFYVVEAQAVDVTADTNDTIRIDSSATAAAGSITSNTVGSSITIICLGGTSWVATNVVGTWSI